MITPLVSIPTDGAEFSMYYLPYVSSWSGPQPESFMVGVSTTDSDTASFTWYNEVVSSNDAWALYVKIFQDMRARRIYCD